MTSLLSKERLKIEIIVGIDKKFDKSNNLKSLATLVGYEISKKFAGCTFWYSGGFWAKDGHECLEEYSSIQEQCNLHIHISLIQSQEQDFFTLLEKNLRKYIDQLGLPIRHVHVEKNKVIENHILL